MNYRFGRICMRYHFRMVKPTMHLSVTELFVYVCFDCTTQLWYQVMALLGHFIYPAETLKRVP